MISPLTTKCATRTSPSTLACSEMTSMLASAGSAMTLPLICPSIRRPPLKWRSPSILVDMPIRLSIVFIVLRPNMNGSPLQINGLLSAHLPFFEHTHLHSFHRYAFWKGQHALHALIMLESQPELIEIDRLSFRKNHHSTFAGLHSTDHELQIPDKLLIPFASLHNLFLFVVLVGCFLVVFFVLVRFAGDAG